MGKPLACALICLCLLAPKSTVSQQSRWIATWATSPQSASPDPEEPLLKLEDQTVRERLRVSVGGSRLRIRLSNEYGALPLVLGSVTVALPANARNVKPGSIHTVTFAGKAGVTLPAHAPILSDPVDLPVAFGSEISISLYFPERVATPTIHALALKSAVVFAHGDQTHEEVVEGGTVSESSIAVTAVFVSAAPGQNLVVAFGDSITDGDGSTLDADRNWPADLIRRVGLVHRQGQAHQSATLAVVNEGIAGNRLLGDGYGDNALARFDRDALELPGVTHVVLLEGVNDIGFPGAKLGGSYLADPADRRTTHELIAAYRQLIDRAHARGIKVIGATLLPFEGVVIPGYYSEAKEADRQTINLWIRTGGAFDGVIDFDAILRDSGHRSRLSLRFASNDHLHPNDDGYRAMADAIDLALFK